MKTLFEMKRERPSDYIAAIDVPVTELPKDFKKVAPDLPELSEVTVERHYSALSRAAFGVDDGSYLLGSCTMKYNPKLNERVAALKGFTDIHPLAPESDVQGAMELIYDLGEALKEITGMDAMTFQPAAGAHGEYTGLKIIDAYHKSRGEDRTKILVPDSAHGTNPASAAACGFEVVNVPSKDHAVDLDALRAAGYDLNEIGSKLADNYVKQITEDGFFHADPHPGNIRIRDGKIVFLDMGMMGTLSERDRRTISQAVKGVARNDPEACLEAVLKLGVVSGDVDRRQLYKDCETMLDRYGSIDLGTMDLSQVVTDIMEIMKKNHIGMPGGLSMLVRGLATVEGVVVDVAPGISVTQVATARISKKFLKDFDLRGNLQRDARALYESAYKALDIPALVSDTLRTGLKGDGRIGVDVHPGEDTEKLARKDLLKI